MRSALLALLAVVIGSVGLLAEEAKIGYVDSQRIRAEFQEFQDAQAKFDKDVETWENQAQQMKVELDELTQELENLSLMLSAEKRKEKEESLKAKQDTLQQFMDATFGTGGKAERRLAELSKPIRDRVLEVIERIAIENNYSMIFDSGTISIAYAKKSLDITDEVLAELAAEE